LEQSYMVAISERLRFPRGVRLASREEIPKCTTETLDRIACADIRTGFVSTTTDREGYSTYIEANVHADEIWAAFAALANALIPRTAAPVIGESGDDSTIGPYTTRNVAIAVLQPHAESLQHNASVEFGIMNQHDGQTEEILVKASKYFQIWTNQPAAAESALNSLGIPRAEQLQFIDEFPNTTEHKAGDKPTREVISAIVDSFVKLSLQ
jgi:hypothetical protein